MLLVFHTFQGHGESPQPADGPQNGGGYHEGTGAAPPSPFPTDLHVANSHGTR